MALKSLKYGTLSLVCATALASAGGDMAPTVTTTEAPSAPWIDAIGIGYGQSKDNIDIYRLTLRKDFRSRWFESDFGYLSGYWEGSLNYWSGRGDENYGIALSPVFAYYFDISSTFRPYLEAGVGASLWSETRMGPRNLSTNFLFEDRIGTGVRVGSWDLSFRYMHYSNASIKKPNDGIDIFIGSVSYYW
jgi:lipid A 3-O-deacylase